MKPQPNLRPPYTSLGESPLHRSFNLAARIGPFMPLREKTVPCSKWRIPTIPIFFFGVGVPIISHFLIVREPTLQYNLMEAGNMKKNASMGDF
jgi:hypothetical protein